MDGPVTLRPVTEGDLSWLSGLRDGPAATGPHEWHGWSDPTEITNAAEQRALEKAEVRLEDPTAEDGAA